MKELWKNRDWLYHKYEVEKLSRKQISEICGCSEVNIQYWMNKFEIKVRSRSEALFFKRKNPAIFITKEMREFIIGNVLGDGGIFSQSNYKKTNREQHHIGIHQNI